MNEEINKIIDSLEGCIGMFDYMITPIESNLLVSYIRELQQENKKIKKQLVQQKEFINYLEDEKDYFVRGCSNVYEDGLGRTRLVNEDIFDEIDNIFKKYREIIGGKKWN